MDGTGDAQQAHARHLRSTASTDTEATLDPNWQKSRHVDYSWRARRRTHRVKFKAAWDAFASTCSTFVPLEAAFQVWFAYYLIGQLGIDRVAREPIVRIGPFMDSPWKAKLGGNGEIKLDAVVTRRPGVYLPHYAGPTRSLDGTGLEALAGLAVIAELKVGSSVANGLHYRAVANDV